MNFSTSPTQFRVKGIDSKKQTVFVTVKAQSEELAIKAANQRYVTKGRFSEVVSEEDYIAATTSAPEEETED